LKDIIDVYDNKAEDFFEKFISCDVKTDNIFKEVFEKNEKVIDIGAGSGRDMHRLKELGIDIYGTEPSKGLRDLLIERFPEFEKKIFPYALPFEKSQFDLFFDGVLLSAVIFHIKEEELEDAIISIKSILKKKGKVVLSISEGERCLDEQSKDKYGRYFSKFSADKYIRLFQKNGFSLKKIWNQIDSMGRKDINWKVLFLSLEE